MAAVVGTANDIGDVHCYPARLAAQVAEAHPKCCWLQSLVVLLQSLAIDLLIRQRPYTLEYGSDGTCSRPICVATEAKPPNLSNTR